MDTDRQVTITLTYSQIMLIVGALNRQATRMDDLADMTLSKKAETEMRQYAIELSQLAGTLMQLSAT